MTRWYIEKKREHFYKEAKKVGYRARSAFKLLQIQKKYNILHKGNIVVDLGAAPGGWSQVSKKFVGDTGQVVGIDLNSINHLDGITFIKGDLTSNVILDEIGHIINREKVDVILSDMSPNISGNYSIDHARSIYLCETSLNIVEDLLRIGGNFVCKIFMGEDLEDYYKKVQNRFNLVKQFSPKASRKSSSEIYIIAKNFNG